MTSRPALTAVLDAAAALEVWMRSNEGTSLRVQPVGERWVASIHGREGTVAVTFGDSVLEALVAIAGASGTRERRPGRSVR